MWVIVATDTKTSFLKTLFSSSLAVVLLIEVPPALHRTFPIAGVYPYLSSREVYETKSIVGYLQTFPLRSNLSAMSSPSLNTDRKGVCVESLKRCCLFIAERMLNTSLQYTVSWSWWYFFTSFIFLNYLFLYEQRYQGLLHHSFRRGRFFKMVLYKWFESLKNGFWIFLAVPKLPSIGKFDVIGLPALTQTVWIVTQYYPTFVGKESVTKP